MSDLETIQSVVANAAKRRRWQRVWRGFWQGFLAGVSLWLLAFAAYKIFPIPFELVLGAAGIGVLFSVVGFFYGASRKMSLLETARWMDEQQKLQERLSTALEMASAPTAENWKQLLISDAAQYAKNFDARRWLPFHLPTASRWVLLVLALGVGLGFLPEYRSKAFVQKQNEKTIIKEVGQQISNVTRRNLAQHPPALEKTKENLETIAELGNQLAKVPLTRGDALKELASAADKLKTDMKELGRNPALKPLDRAARENSRSGGNVSADLQKQIASLEKALGDKGNHPDALAKMKSDLQKAQQAAAEMAGKNSNDSAEAKQQLAQSLANLTQQAEEMGLPLDDLNDAIAALQANQTDQFLKNLDAALNELEKTQQMAKALQQLQQQAASKLGKDLAEQLKNGQAEAAQKTLEQMVGQLKQSNLSPEQIKKLLEEVSKAVDPAGEYGKVKDLLNSAVSQMKQGERPGAAKSLADAADELKKLLQQMNDAKSLAASLDALERAQQCIGSGKGWAQCKKPGRPGYGTGFTAEENKWLYMPNYDERQDASKNSPGKNFHDWSKSGEGKLADNLAPDKLRGTINPGAPMPSITLKGVSIKGQSTVQYQEAVNAAQSEAQSALNQDQVPRAYQGAVKNYFDDLQE